MRMIEANLFPAIPHLHVECQNREVTSMSDFVHTGHRPRIAADNTTIESRLVFSVCYVLFLFRAVARRLIVRREQYAVRDDNNRQSIFREAASAARVVFVSSFMGL
jgi:hypothetical protein